MAGRKGVVRRGQVVPKYQRLRSRARMVEDFADLIEELGWADWRVECERLLARGLWCMAAAAESGHGWQLSLFEWSE